MKTFLAVVLLAPAIAAGADPRVVTNPCYEPGGCPNHSMQEFLESREEARKEAERRDFLRDLHRDDDIFFLFPEAYRNE